MTDQFPEHFDGAPVNPEGLIPDGLPFEFSNGKCTYKIDAEFVHILNKSEEDDEGLTWSEPLASYEAVRRWVIAEQMQEAAPRGLLARLFGRTPKFEAVETGPRHAVIALAHKKEPWMSVVLYSRPLAEDENGEDIVELAERYRALIPIP